MWIDGNEERKRSQEKQRLTHSMPLKSKNNRIENRLRIILSAAILLLIILSTISYRSLSSFKVKRAWVVHTSDVIFNIQRLLVELKDAENNHRAYLVSEDENFRRPYINSKIGVMEYYNESQELTVDNPKQQKRFKQLLVLIDRWYFIAEEIHIAKEDSLLNKAMIKTSLKREIDVMDNIQSILSLIQETEENLLDKRNNDVEVALEENYLIISIFAALTLIIILLAYLHFIRDIQIRSALELKLQESIHRLSQTNQELEQFAYVASHDLQEPLRKVISFSDIILRKHSDQLDEKGKAYFDRMINSTSRMQTLIQDLLNFSRSTRNSGDRKSIKINHLINEVLEDLSEVISESNGKIKLKLSEETLVNGTPVQIRQLIQNILSNGIKYHKKDVTPIIKVKTKLIPASKLENKIPLLVSEQFIEITINDNGIGFDEQYLDRIFTIFQRLHGRSEYTGTGIGLAIAKRVVENHNGYITAKSELGKGSTFFIYLPVEKKA
jgi:signal transduction histidine kinase